MILDSKIPEGPLNQKWTNYKAAQKWHYCRLIWVIAGLVFFCSVFCSCKDYWCKKEGQYIEKYIVYKFHDGEDYSQYFLISDDFKLQPNIIPSTHRPIPLHGGYYLNASVSNSFGTLTYLSFTYDEYESGDVPDDWNYHWEDYVLADCPYEEYYSVGISDCYDFELNNMPGYCAQCSNTYFVDTTWLSRALDNGEFFSMKSVFRRI